MKIWIEIKNVINMDGSKPDIKNDSSNVRLTLENGTNVGLNVWTYGSLKIIIEKDSKTGENSSGIYQLPPELLVYSLERSVIEKDIKDLLVKDQLSHFKTNIRS